MKTETTTALPVTLHVHTITEADLDEGWGDWLEATYSDGGWMDEVEDEAMGYVDLDHFGEDR